MDFWIVMATRFKDVPNVIGYDFLNEPWLTNSYEDIMLWIDTQKFDRETLFPILQRANEVIRSVD